ncbi:MAG: homocysteine S-methyltransferase family protein [Armatimonadetes bacterium]|nr:homocysteine S-methyltransferase family protein [Armatimonadota bacterium]
MTPQNKDRNLLRRLREGVLVCDGAMGTLLASEGYRSGDALELLSVERPDAIRAVHRAYVEAGAELILTNTFQATSPALARHGLADRMSELVEAAVGLARGEAGDRAFVGGDIGPTGKILEPYGDYPEDEARTAFAEQARLLVEGGVDLLLLETFSSLEEIEIAAQAATETGVPVACSMSFDPSGRTAFGVTPEQAASRLEAAGAAIVGANCGTVTPLEIVDIVAKFKAATDLPIMVQPNAGRPQQTAAGTVYPEGPEAMAEAAARQREAGASIIGTCCGSTPEHTKAIVARLSQP